MTSPEYQNAEIVEIHASHRRLTVALANREAHSRLACSGGDGRMAATATPTLGLTRDDLDLAIEPLVARLSAIEDAAGGNADVVTRDEFRLFKWLGTFALATVVAGFGLLYEQVSDVRVGMERLHGEVQREIHGLRETMYVEIASIRSEMEAKHAALTEQMHAGFASMREEISAVRERVARVETLLERGNANDA